MTQTGGDTQPRRAGALLTPSSRAAEAMVAFAPTGWYRSGTKLEWLGRHLEDVSFGWRACGAATDGHSDGRCCRLQPARRSGRGGYAWPMEGALERGHRAEL